MLPASSITSLVLKSSLKLFGGSMIVVSSSIIVYVWMLFVPMVAFWGLFRTTTIVSSGSSAVSLITVNGIMASILPTVIKLNPSPSRKSTPFVAVLAAEI